MYNPLYELTPQALIGLIRQRSFFWVQQSYPRGIEMGDKAAFLLTPYETLEKAQEHFDHLAADSERRLYQLHLNPGDPIGKDQDGQDLIAASKRPRGIRYYLPYTDGKSLPGWLNRQVKEGAKIFGWGGRSTEVEARLGFHYGELVIRYFFKHEQQMIPLREIEKI